MAEGGPDKLSLVVHSGDYGKIHYALVMAAASAAVGRTATLFFTMEALKALLKPAADGSPAWRKLPADGRAGAAGAIDDGYIAKGVAGFEELLTSSVDLGVRFLVCDMGLRALDLTRADLRGDVPVETGGVVTFLNDASGRGAVVVV